jgi:hypothetical protein
LTSTSELQELIPAVQYPFSLKFEDTAKGVRFNVHVNGNTSEDVIQQMFTTYLKARKTAIDNKIPLAPMDSK